MGEWWIVGNATDTGADVKGHTGVIAMRQRGLKPSAVFVCDFPTPTDWAEWGEYPTITVDGESIPLLDLRFLVGLHVHVAGFDDKRNRELFEACKEAGAAFVIAAGMREVDPWRLETTWVDVWRKS